MDAIRIHIKDDCHSYGIEYNFNESDKDRDATAFIKACQTLLDKQYGWFWRTGSGSNKGYQFFEMLNSDDPDILFEEAQKIADALKLKLTV